MNLAGAGLLVRASEYDGLMQTINEIQLNLEEVCKELKREDVALPEAETVKGYVKKMEKYLSHLVHEYEQKMPAFQGTPPSLPLSDMPNLQDLINPHPKSRIEQEFTRPYYDAIATLRGGTLSSAALGTTQGEAPNPEASTGRHRYAVPRG